MGRALTVAASTVGAGSILDNAVAMARIATMRKVLRLDGLMASVVLASFLLAGFAGCGGCGVLDKGTPEKPSPYGGVTATGEMKTPDRVLYDSDFAIATAYSVVHSFVKYEYDNRAALAGTPEIKKSADKIRAGAPGWFKSAVAVRDAYAANPTVENRTALQKALDVLQQAVIEANRNLVAKPL